MRLLLIFFFSVFVLPLYGQSSDVRIRPLDTAIVNRASFIALVEMQQQVANVIECTILKSFKVSKPQDETTVLRLGDGLPEFHEGDVYLIFAADDSGMNFYIDKESRILRKEDSEKDMAYLQASLPCTNAKLINHKRACHKISRPVCGCDSKTYANVCEALKNGIVKFSQGECH
jgi:hypothetical protein